MTQPNQYMIGVLDDGLGGMATLDSILLNADIPVDPQPEFRPYASFSDLGSGGRRGMGFPVASWHWSFLSQEHRKILQAYISGLSSTILIRTPTRDSDIYNEEIWHTYQCEAIWPSGDENFQVKSVMDFTLEFRMMVVQD